MTTHSPEPRRSETGIISQLQKFKTAREEQKDQQTQARYVRRFLRRMMREILLLKREGALLAITEAQRDLTRLYDEMRASTDHLATPLGAVDAE